MKERGTCVLRLVHSWEWPRRTRRYASTPQVRYPAVPACYPVPAGLLDMAVAMCHQSICLFPPHADIEFDERCRPIRLDIHPQCAGSVSGDSTLPRYGCSASCLAWHAIRLWPRVRARTVHYAY
ncbi:hypothetical protein OH77DRAFT_985759 [Trametes cingulata]|nr:hypothetical protein OH77DRAFT_985759 [Trametes cingulata]